MGRTAFVFSRFSACRVKTAYFSKNPNSTEKVEARFTKYLNLQEMTKKKDGILGTDVCEAQRVLKPCFNAPHSH